MRGEEFTFAFFFFPKWKLSKIIHSKVVKNEKGTNFSPREGKMGSGGREETKLENGNKVKKRRGRAGKRGKLKDWEKGNTKGQGLIG